MEYNEKNTYYRLYIDECGDPNLENFDRTFPIFTLCGVLIPEEKLAQLETNIKEIKNEFWPEQDIIFHSRDIRNCSKIFTNLLDNEIKQQFYSKINGVLGCRDVYTIVCCCILKEPFIERFNTGEDVYGLSLKYLLERAIFHIDDSTTSGSSKLRIIVERRNPNQNQSLLKYYNGLRVTGTKWITPERFVDRIKSLKFVGKKDNIIGLQIADLIAYPISRMILNPDRDNPAYNIIAHNIYTYKGARLGFKIIPH